MQGSTTSHGLDGRRRRVDDRARGVWGLRQQWYGDPAPYVELPAFYQRKRDLFAAGLARTRFKLLPSAGTYFQCVDITAVSDLGEDDFCQWLTREIGVAAIPLSAFYGSGFDQRVVRFCFAKKDETLHHALERLAKL